MPDRLRPAVDPLGKNVAAVRLAHHHGAGVSGLGYGQRIRARDPQFLDHDTWRESTGLGITLQCHSGTHKQVGGVRRRHSLDAAHFVLQEGRPLLRGVKRDHSGETNLRMLFTVV